MTKKSNKAGGFPSIKSTFSHLMKSKKLTKQPGLTVRDVPGVIVKPVLFSFVKMALKQ
jgi:hypothetical protein